MQVYIANLGKYNEGELVGAWFTPPIDYEELEERIGLNGEYEEYAIHDYELPFEFSEYTSISEINRLPTINKDHVFAELLNPVYAMKDNKVTAIVTVKYLDQETKMTQFSQYELVLEKAENWKIVK